MKSSDPKKPSRRRVRYQGTHPRRFEDKYKELDPERDPQTIAKVIASGKTRPVNIAPSWWPRYSNTSPHNPANAART